VTPNFVQSNKFKVAALSIGQALNSVIVILVGVVMARVLDKVEVAAYQQTFLAYRSVAPFLALGIGHGIYYFLPTEKLRIRGRVVDSIVVLSGMGLLFAIFILLGGNQLLAQRFENPQVAELLIWMVPYALFMVPASHHAAVLIARDRAALAAVLSTVTQLLIGSTTALLLVTVQDVEIALIGNVVVSVLTAVCAIVLMIKVTPQDSLAPSPSAISQLVTYSFPLGLASMIGVLALSLDRILVSILLEPEVYAAYAFGAREIPLITILLSSLASVLVVEMRKEVVGRNHLAAANLFRKCSTLTIPVLFPLGAFFIVNAESFITILYTEEYKDAAIPFAIYSGTVLMRSSYFGPLLAAYGQNWFILWSTILALVVNLVASIFAIKSFGAPGAAWATLISLFIVSAPINYWRLCKVSKLPLAKFIPVKVYLKNLIVFVGLIGVFLFVQQVFEDYSLFINAAIFGVVISLMNIDLVRKNLEGILQAIRKRNADKD